ncbi:MAG: undecaprenyl-phosphate glucose phosphotransferase [Sulfuritalea sp.]|nr:undecaprenyl-phosphate glucose phosphotransferase [Sulfuritalea sp.]
MIASSSRQTSIFRTPLSLVSLLGILLDPLVIVAALLLAALHWGEPLNAQYVLLALLAFSLSFPGRSLLRHTRGAIVRDIFSDWVLLASILLFFGYASGYLSIYSQQALVTWFVATPLLLTGIHLALRHYAPKVLSSRAHQRTAIVVGMNATGLRLAQQLRDDPLQATRLAGFFDDRCPLRLNAAGERQALLGRIDELVGFIKQHRIDLIYITLPMASQPRILNLLDALRDTTASIYFAPDIFVTDLIQGRIDQVGGMPVVAVCESPFTGVNGLLKRGSDIFLSLLILVLIAPLLLAVALGIKLTSPGPALFRQRRYGLDGKEIVVYKFRSMTVCEDGPSIAQATRNDARVTRFGGFLRRTSLDELPQLFNVLQGRMSIVGPRPHAVAHNELYRKLIGGYMLRHKVKPGITGWAQVNGYRGETETVEKMQRRIEFDLDYLRHWSLVLDLWIIAKTVLVVLRDRHAY